MSPQLNIIEYAGKKYYQVKSHEKIKRYALHSILPTSGFQPIKHEKTIGKTPYMFSNGRYFFNRLTTIYNNKPQKFDTNNLYKTE